LRGKYYCLRVYNQSLTEQQVLNNWQIDQNLYNI
jgi:hypothetical protein